MTYLPCSTLMKNSSPLSGLGDGFTLNLISVFPAKFVSVFAPSTFLSGIGYLTQLLKGKSLTITALTNESCLRLQIQQEGNYLA